VATTAPVSAPRLGLKKPTLIVIGAIALYFAYRYALHYFNWSEASYGYYWPNRIPLIAHITGGLVALLVGVFQLWSGQSSQAMGAHPWSGRAYVGAVLLGSLAAMVLAVTVSVRAPAFGFAWGVGLFVLAAAWLTITAIALLCIKHRNVKAHRQWMTRSYIVTFAFVLFRVSTDYLPHEAWWGITAAEMAVTMVWTAWVVPLLAYEIYLQYREL